MDMDDDPPPAAATRLNHATFADRVAQLHAFQAEYGHIHVNRKDDPALKDWCDNVRFARSHPDARGIKITPQRIAALDELGFRWTSTHAPTNAAEVFLNPAEAQRVRRLLDAVAQSDVAARAIDEMVGRYSALPTDCVEALKLVAEGLRCAHREGRKRAKAMTSVPYVLEAYDLRRAADRENDGDPPHGFGGSESLWRMKCFVDKCPRPPVPKKKKRKRKEVEEEGAPEAATGAKQDGSLDAEAVEGEGVTNRAVVAKPLDMAEAGEDDRAEALEAGADEASPTRKGRVLEAHRVELTPEMRRAVSTGQPRDGEEQWTQESLIDAITSLIGTGMVHAFVETVLQRSKGSLMLDGTEYASPTAIYKLYNAAGFTGLPPNGDAMWTRETLVAAMAKLELESNLSAKPFLVKVLAGGGKTTYKNDSSIYRMYKMWKENGGILRGMGRPKGSLSQYTQAAMQAAAEAAGIADGIITASPKAQAGTTTVAACKRPGHKVGIGFTKLNMQHPDIVILNKVLPDSIFAGHRRVLEGAVVLEVNGTRVRGPKQAARLVADAEGEVRLTVKQVQVASTSKPAKETPKKSEERPTKKQKTTEKTWGHLTVISAEKRPDGRVGLSIASHSTAYPHIVVVSKVLPGSIFDRDRSSLEGALLVEVNGTPVRDPNHAAALVKEVDGEVRLAVKGIVVQEVAREVQKGAVSVTVPVAEKAKPAPQKKARRPEKVYSAKELESIVSDDFMNAILSEDFTGKPPDPLKKWHKQILVAAMTKLLGTGKIKGFVEKVLEFAEERLILYEDEYRTPRQIYRLYNKTGFSGTPPDGEKRWTKEALVNAMYKIEQESVLSTKAFLTKVVEGGDKCDIKSTGGIFRMYSTWKKNGMKLPRNAGRPRKCGQPSLNMMSEAAKMALEMCGGDVNTFNAKDMIAVYAASMKEKAAAEGLDPESIDVSISDRTARAAMIAAAMGGVGGRRTFSNDDAAPLAEGNDESDLI